MGSAELALVDVPKPLELARTAYQVKLTRTAYTAAFDELCRWVPSARLLRKVSDTLKDASKVLASLKCSACRGKQRADSNHGYGRCRTCKGTGTKFFSQAIHASKESSTAAFNAL